MAIRTLVAAAALVAFTTPAFAQSAEEITILDESVSTGGLFAIGLGGFGASLGLIAAVVTIAVINEADTTNDTDS